MSSVYIKRIKVTKLFGNINYDIDLSVGEPTAIIIAPNGMGKTTILNLISHMFNPSYESFTSIKDVPFDAFCCGLSNGADIILTRKKVEGSIEDWKFSFLREEETESAEALIEGVNFNLQIKREGEDDLSFDYFSPNKTENKTDRFEIDRYLEEFEEFNEVLGRRDSKPKYSYIWKKQKETLKSVGCDINVGFIRANRIQPIIELDSRSRRSRRERPHQMSALEAASEVIASAITDATDIYNDKVSNAKDQLPSMFLRDRSDILPYGDFNQRWEDYTDELRKFQEVGLILPDKASLIEPIDEEDYENNPDKKKFLSVYIDAFEKTTGPLKEIYGRLNLLKTIFEDRNAITGKKITFDRRGVQIESGGQKLALDKLSSGEQHDFIMFYDLIFKTENGGLVLIDEPEISLHIEWQETFLDRLIEICKMNDLHAIIATHSPNIVNSHYDCIVDKGETNG